jgi:hypothetical protein
MSICWEASVGKLVPFENIDRLLNVEVRPDGLPQGVMQRAYDVVRGAGEPLVYQAAKELDSVAGTIGFLTGVHFPPHFEMGEIDGPIGTVVLGNVLGALGHKTEVLVEDHLVPLIDALSQKGAGHVKAIPVSSVTVDQVIGSWSALVSIERIGVAEDGRRHTIVGTPFEGGYTIGDAIVEGMNAAGKPTIGLGDGGNEIGFGKILESVGRASPHPDAWTTTATKQVLPVCVSNLGAYGIATSLAVMHERLDLVPTSQHVEELIRLANSMGCLDGGMVDPDFIGDDGIPMVGIAAYIDLMGVIARQHFNPNDRHF